MSDIQLSQSSHKVLKSCQTKYYHKKVAKTPYDSDHEESDAMNFGKAFHQVLELSLHTSAKDDAILKAMKDNAVGLEHRPMLKSMLDNYLKVHAASNLKVVKCELQIATKEFVGYIDFIAQGEDGWWLGDNKTASKHDPAIANRLHKDLQINLYAKFAEDVGHTLGMTGPFLGFRYRQSIKTKNKTVSGIINGTPTYDIVIMADQLDPETAWKDHMDAYDLAKKLHEGEAPSKNYGACYDYFRPCEYFSQCHGNLASEKNCGITIHTADSLESENLLG